MPGGKDPDDPRDPELGVPDEETLAMPLPELQALGIPQTAGDVERLIERVIPPPENKLLLERHLAAGGMGSIEVVLDVALQRRLAKKVIAPELSKVEGAVQLFLREARITGRLDHPSIVPVHELARDAAGRLYFSMKLVEGQTFGEWVAQLEDSAPSAEDLYELIGIVLKVCDALEFAHSRGVIHCDVKPANIMVGAFGEVYVMDWGLAHLSGAASAQGVASASRPTLIGTPAYMSSEQAGCLALDERTDVFAIGALLYFALARRPPFSGGSGLETIALARRGEFTPLAELAAPQELPMELERIVIRAMSHKPEDRYPSVAQLKTDLKRFLRGGVEFPLRQIAAGEHILREGEPGEEVFILSSGRAQIYRTIGGRKSPIREIETGEVFGEMAILTTSPRTASVLALEDCEVRVVTRQMLEREMKGMKPWLVGLTLTLAHRFRELEESVATRPG